MHAVQNAFGLRADLVRAVRALRPERHATFVVDLVATEQRQMVRIRVGVADDRRRGIALATQDDGGDRVVALEREERHQMQRVDRRVEAERPVAGCRAVREHVDAAQLAPAEHRFDRRAAAVRERPGIGNARRAVDRRERAQSLIWEPRLRVGNVRELVKEEGGCAAIDRGGQSGECQDRRRVPASLPGIHHHCCLLSP